MRGRPDDVLARHTPLHPSRRLHSAHVPLVVTLRVDLVARDEALAKLAENKFRVMFMVADISDPALVPVTELQQQVATQRTKLLTQHGMDRGDVDKLTWSAEDGSQVPDYPGDASDDDARQYVSFCQQLMLVLREYEATQVRPGTPAQPFHGASSHAFALARSA